MLASLRAQKLLDGFRGATPVDREALCGLVERFATMVLELSADIFEVDVNPLVTRHDSGAPLAVDALFVLRAASTSPASPAAPTTSSEAGDEGARDRDHPPESA
jgi:hypothetical protein